VTLHLLPPLPLTTSLGIIAGGVSACVTFVVQSSKGSNVRGVFTGEVVRSNTTWNGRSRDKLEQGLATHGVYVIQLQGHIFFGNIQQVVKTIEAIIQEGYKKESIGSSPFASPRHGYGCVASLRTRIAPSLTSTSSSALSEGSPAITTPPVSVTPPPDPEYVVLDCSFVSGLDGNAVDGLLKLQVPRLARPAHASSRLSLRGCCELRNMFPIASS
jgi:hypothetical protein